MREFMLMIFSVQLFVICVSGGMWFFGNELGITDISDQSLDFDTLEDGFNATAQSYETDPFNALFIFGDFGRAITQFMDILSGGYVIDMMALFGMSESIQQVVQVAFGISTLMVLIYLISGRG